MRDFQLPGRSAVYAQNGMCATSHPLAARVAVSVLENDGNAVDAAIAAAVLLGICEPLSTGIGGDCFALIKPANSDDIIALNGSGRAPGNIDPQVLRNRGMTCIDGYSPEAITVPGAIDAFCTLSADWGRKDLKEVLQPAIDYAENGVPVAPRVSRDWHNSADKIKGVARKFYLDNGRAPECGSLFRAPNQAEVLRKVSKYGRSGFYEGDVADDMLKSLQDLGGLHNEDDFTSTQSSYTTPISGKYQDLELIEHPPNGQGAMAILLANILSQFDLPEMDPFGIERTHFEAEATKLAMDARDRFIADPDHVVHLDHMMSMETAIALAKLIRPDTVLSQVPVKTSGIHKDTVYLTVVDRDQMAVSMIYSIFESFGGGYASEKFGINFHNRGAGFNLIPGHPNEIGPGKRPLHTIIPAMLKSGKHMLMPFGVMGAHYQAVGHVRFLTNIVDYKLDLQTALDMPRSFAVDGKLQLERGYRDSVHQGLTELGHKTEVPDSPLGGGQAIYIDYVKGVLIGASEMRKDGCAIGY